LHRSRVCQKKSNSGEQDLVTDIRVGSLGEELRGDGWVGMLTSITKGGESSLHSRDIMSKSERKEREKKGDIITAIEVRVPLQEQVDDVSLPPDSSSNQRS
jgi:hypothetical protein